MNIYGNVNLNTNNVNQSVLLTQLTAAPTLNLQISDNGSIYSMSSASGVVVTLPLASTLPKDWGVTLYNNTAANTTININSGGSDVLNFTFTTMTLAANSYCNVRLINPGVFSFVSINPYKILTFKTPSLNFVFSGTSNTVLCANLPSFSYDFVVLSASVVLDSLTGYVSSPTMSIDLNGTVGSIAPSQQFPSGTPTALSVYNLSLNQVQPRCHPGTGNSINFNLSATGVATTMTGYCMVTGYVTQNTYPANASA